MIGTTLAHYRITAALGAGGMGEVWRAEDEKLGREVALKVLPADVAGDPDRLARFEREAKVLASLNHPNIAHLYGLESIAAETETETETESETDAGSGSGPGSIHSTVGEGFTPSREAVPSGTGTESVAGSRPQDLKTSGPVTFLVMELVEGEDLSERIARGAIPVLEAIPIALQIAEALEAAHEAGIVHRDLKPANIKITEDATVKVLDFGLAKAWESDHGDSSLSLSPTLTQHATAAGVILGTAAYMSPEQARGKKVDRRADIWSFGVVVWEMLTGRVLFNGETVTDVLAAVVRQDVDVDQLPRETPRNVRDLVARCLDRDQRERLRDIGEARIALARPSMVEDEVSKRDGASKLVTRRSFAIASAMTGAGLVLGVGLGRRWGGLVVAGSNGEPFTITRLTGSGNVLSAAISPDGNFVAYVQMDRGLQSLWLRQVASGQTLRIVPEAEQFFWGHAFSRDGNEIVFGLKTPGDRAGGIFTVSALGGPQRRIVDGVDSFPAFSPDGKWLAFARAAFPAAGESALMIAATDGSEEYALAVFKAPELVAPNFYTGPAWAPDGRQIVISVSDRGAGTSDTRAWLVSVEREGGKVSTLSDPGWVQAAQVGYLPDGSGLIAIARFLDQLTTQIWHVDRASGEVSPITNDLNDHRVISLSGDGNDLVSIAGDRSSAIWVGPRNGSKPPQRMSWNRLDGVQGVSFLPDGRLVHSSNEGGLWGLWTMTPDGGERVPLLTVEPEEYILGVAAAGSGDVYYKVRNRAGVEVRVAGASATRVLVSGVANEAIDVSRDGVLVYGADVNGQRRLYRLSPDSAEPVQITELNATLPAIDPSGERVAFYYTDAEDRYRLGVVTTADGKLIWRSEVATPGIFTQLCLRDEGLYLTNMPGDRVNVWVMPLDGGEPQKLTDFDDKRIWDFDVSDDETMLAVARGRRDRDAVLIKGFRGAASGRST